MSRYQGDRRHELVDRVLRLLPAGDGDDLGPQMHRVRAEEEPVIRISAGAPGYWRWRRAVVRWEIGTRNVPSSEREKPASGPARARSESRSRTREWLEGRRWSDQCEADQWSAYPQLARFACDIDGLTRYLSELSTFGEASRSAFEVHVDSKSAGASGLMRQPCASRSAQVWGGSWRIPGA
jgi:hypothetical protein